MRREATLARAEARVNKLCSKFSHYLQAFDEKNLFTGPSLYFHFRTLQRLRQLGLGKALQDDLFLEYLYATLASWGLHRMGPVGAKLVPFEEFSSSLRNQTAELQPLEGRGLLSLSSAEVDVVTRTLWQVMARLQVSESETKLVANSKALHHVLPELVPPIDREYTLRFFQGHKTISGRDMELFLELYPLFYLIGSRVAGQITGHVGRGFHTSPTKVIDNAIVGFVLTELPKKEV